MDLDHRRIAPVIVSALLGAVMLIAVSQVFGRARVEPGGNHALPDRLRVLTGIIAYTDPSQGFAIIGSSVDDTYLARPGELLPDGASIREIYPSHVVLEYGGRLETVGMYRRGEPAGAAYIQTPGDAMPSQAPRPSAEPPSGPRPSDTRASDTTGTEHRSFHTQSTDVLPRQAQPEVPLPSAQDPANLARISSRGFPRSPKKDVTNLTLHVLA
jgi:type II secretory pathway component PulC